MTPEQLQAIMAWVNARLTEVKEEMRGRDTTSEWLYTREALHSMFEAFDFDHDPHDNPIVRDGDVT